MNRRVMGQHGIQPPSLPLPSARSFLLKPADFELEMNNLVDEMRIQEEEEKQQQQELKLQLQQTELNHHQHQQQLMQFQRVNSEQHEINQQQLIFQRTQSEPMTLLGQPLQKRSIIRMTEGY